MAIVAAQNWISHNGLQKIFGAFLFAASKGELEKGLAELDDIRALLFERLSEIIHSQPEAVSFRDFRNRELAGRRRLLSDRAACIGAQDVFSFQAAFTRLGSR
jgi:hypothetical protein